VKPIDDQNDVGSGVGAAATFWTSDATVETVASVDSVAALVEMVPSEAPAEAAVEIELKVAASSIIIPGAFNLLIGDHSAVE